MVTPNPKFRLFALIGVVGATFVAIQLTVLEPHQRVMVSESRLPTQQQIEQDLALRVELNPRSKTVNAGDDPWVKAVLVNTSKTRTHRVVKPGHGSEIAYREPHFHWTATSERNGKQAPVPECRIGYCGTCLISASAWEKDWVALAPGEQLELRGGPLLEFQQVGRVKLRAHYEFLGDRGSKMRSPDELGLFAFVPPFSLNSDPVEFEVVRPLEVHVAVKGTLKVHKKTKLSDLLDITLVNQSQNSITCSSPTLHANARLHLEIKGEFPGWPPSLTDERTAYGLENVSLKPGGTVSLLGASDFANGIDGNWDYPVPDTVWLRAGYTPTTWQHSPTVLSDWVTVRVEK